MKINYKRLAIFIAIPLIIGTLVGLLTMKETSNMDSIIPGWIFPVVWTILYTLMGVSSYLVYEKENYIPRIYIVQLIFNYLWVFVFFTFKWYLFAFIWIIILILLVAIMIKKFYDIDRLAGYLQIPYIIWLLVAAVLNFMYLI